jgi:hypothetical protein
MPKNMRSLDVSSGGFSWVGVTDDDSDAVEGAVETSGESCKEPDEAEAITNMYKRKRKEDGS